MKSLRTAATLAIAALLLSFSPAARAQEQSKGTKADSAAIQQVFTEFYQSFSRHDAHAASLVFAEDADFTNMRGVHRRGRKEIEDWLAGLFKGALQNASRTDTVRNIRYFSPELAAVDADTVITGTKAADGSEIPPRKGLMVVVMSKQNGRWLIGDFHEVEFPPAR